MGFRAVAVCIAFSDDACAPSLGGDEHAKEVLHLANELLDRPVGQHVCDVHRLSAIRHDDPLLPCAPDGIVLGADVETKRFEQPFDHDDEKGLRGKGGVALHVHLLVGVDKAPLGGERRDALAVVCHFVDLRSFVYSDVFAPPSPVDHGSLVGRHLVGGGIDGKHHGLCVSVASAVCELPVEPHVADVWIENKFGVGVLLTICLFEDTSQPSDCGESPLVFRDDIVQLIDI